MLNYLPIKIRIKRQVVKFFALGSNNPELNGDIRGKQALSVLILLGIAAIVVGMIVLSWNQPINCHRFP